MIFHLIVPRVVPVEGKIHEGSFPICRCSASSVIGSSACTGAAADDKMRVGATDGCVHVFSETGRMPPNFVKFIGDAALQKIEPYKAFDNVYYVGICRVSAWLITSPNGHVLIDTLYGPYTSQILSNIRALGFDPKDIKLVVKAHPVGAAQGPWSGRPTISRLLIHLDIDVLCYVDIPIRENARRCEALLSMNFRLRSRHCLPHPTEQVGQRERSLERYLSMPESRVTSVSD